MKKMVTELTCDASTVSRPGFKEQPGEDDNGRHSSSRPVGNETLLREPPSVIIDCVSHSDESLDLCNNSKDAVPDRGTQESVDVNNVAILHKLSELQRAGGATISGNSAIVVPDTQESKPSHRLLVPLDAPNGVVSLMHYNLGDSDIPESSGPADSCPKLGFPKEKGPVLHKGESGLSESQEFETNGSRSEILIPDKSGSCANNVFSAKLTNIDDNAVKYPLRIQIIDGTALVETSQVKKFDGSVTNEQRLKMQVNTGQINNSRAIEETVTNVSFNVGVIVEKNDEGSKVYSRKELEALRYQGMDAQRRRWVGVHSGLGPVLQKEYEGLEHSHPRLKQLQQPQQQKKKKNKKNTKNPVFQNQASATSFGEASSEAANCDIENVNPMVPASGLFPVDDETTCLIGRGGYVEDEDSDEAYDNIQKPAFFITGEPDFSSGPPEDGIEYLKRVRWEAAQIPKVKVAKVDASKLNKKPTVYMPQIPDIPKCPAHLLPLKAWQDAFVADFEELRLALSYQVVPKTDDSGSVQSNSFDKKFETVVHENNSDAHNDSCVSVVSSLGPENCGNSKNICTDDAMPSVTSDDSVMIPSAATSANSPTLSTILRMNSVTRVSMLRKHISLAEKASILSWKDCVWLFVLCAVVDLPLDSDSCASLRSLLRKCASLRAVKEELDEEVVMLNILATIAGKYFGQSEEI